VKGILYALPDDDRAEYIPVRRSQGLTAGSELFSLTLSTTKTGAYGQLRMAARLLAPHSVNGSRRRGGRRDVGELGPRGPGELAVRGRASRAPPEPVVVAGGDLVADLPVGADAAHVGIEVGGLPGMFAPTHQESAIGSSVIWVTSLWWSTQSSSAEGSGSIVSRPVSRRCAGSR